MRNEDSSQDSSCAMEYWFGDELMGAERSDSNLGREYGPDASAPPFFSCFTDTF